MSLRTISSKKSLPFLIALLASVSAAQAQILANPFGKQEKTTKQSASSSAAQQAIAALPQYAAAKANSNHLIRMMSQESNDLIVEFVHSTAMPMASKENFAAQLAANRTTIQGEKQRVASTFAAGVFEYIRDYDALPMAFVRVKNRAALAKLLSHGEVKAVYENIPHTLQLAESLPLIEQPQANLAGKDGTGTTVAVLDSGADYTRSEFGSCTSPAVPSNCRVVAAADIAPNDSQRDDNGHGTNVSAIVAGVAPAAKIVALDVVHPDGYIYSADVIAAINWAITNKATYNIVSMNMSFGNSLHYPSECTSSYAATPFANARAAGIVPVVSAGNSGFLNGVSEPACAPGAVRVGAVYDSNFGSISFPSCTDASTAADKVTCFSNGGNLLTLLAPGSIITAGGYSYSGTSQAAPHVAGAVAALRATNMAPNESINQTVNRLVNNGVMVLDQRNGIQKPRLNLYAALNGLLYDTAVEELYLGFFGRPADTAALVNVSSGLQSANAPKTIVGLNDAYSTNSYVKSLVDGFAASAEFNSLYTGNTSSFITAIYQAMFNRDPDPQGLSFWASAIDNGNVTKGKAVLSIMAGAITNNTAQGKIDATTVIKKAAVAANFTAAIDTPAEVSAYAGSVPAAKARLMLKNVTSATDVNAYQATVNATLAAIVGGY